MRKVSLFIVALIVWLLFTWPFSGTELTVGVLASLLVAWLVGDMFVQKPGALKDINRYLWFFYYLPVFLWACIKANIDVAFRVSHPDVPIRPGIVKVKTGLKSDTGLTFLANSITLTPGTLSVDIDRENGFLYVHWIDVKDKDVEGASKLIVEKFERILKRIFE